VTWIYFDDLNVNTNNDKISGAPNVRWIYNNDQCLLFIGNQ